MFDASGRLLGKPRTTSTAASVPGLWTMQQQLEAKRSNSWSITNIGEFATTLLLGDNANGSTTITDSSSAGATFTNAGLVTNSSTQVKYGAGSLYFANNGHTLVSPSSSNYAFGTGDFTIEWWHRVVSPTYVYSYGIFFGLGNYGSGANIAIGFLGTSIGVMNQPAGGFSQSTSRGTDGVFHHVALARSSGVTRFFYDGTLIGTTDLTTGSFGNSVLYINRISAYSNSGVNNGLYIDEFRILKGFAAYTASFTPPSSFAP
jgi:hypothetical protein